MDRINTQDIYRFTLAHEECKSHVLLNNCKQNITSLSLLVGTTVPFVILIFVLYIFEWPFNTGFTVHTNGLSCSTKKRLSSISLLYSGEDAIPTGGGVSFNVDFKPVKKSKRRRKIKKRAQTLMKSKVEEKQEASSFFFYSSKFLSFA